ncbi:hypothetical protein BHE74_00030773 [Ensete ventricosum]|nr:hypothetical protein BHE74_00030773 [Ensete ventricosum]
MEQLSYSGSNDEVGPRQEFARRFTEGIGKLARNTLGDRRKKTKRLIVRMSEATVLAGVNHLYPDFSDTFDFLL